MITLSLLRHDDPAGPALEQRPFVGGTLVIGRSGDADWVIADPNRVISKRHCELRLANGALSVVDSSANGVFLNGAGQRLTVGEAHPLQVGDRLRLGDYVVRIDPALPPRGLLSAADLDNPFAPPGARLEPGRAAPVPRVVHARSPVFGLGSGAPDPLQAPEAPISALAQAQWPQPAAAPEPPARPRGIAAAFEKPMRAVEDVRPSDWAIPENWDEWTPDGPPPAPDHAARDARPAGGPTGAAGADVRNLPPPSPQAPATSPPAGADAATGASEAPPAHPDRALLLAFLDGARLRPGDFADCNAEEVMRTAGEIYRATVLGLSDILHDRAFVKDQFRIAQTMVRDRQSNPLRMFDPNESAILLLTARLPRLLTGGSAITQACADLKKHQLALLAGLRVAIATTLAALDPGETGSRPGWLARLFGRGADARHARLVATYAAFRAEAEDSPDSLVNRELRRGYEAFLDEARRAEDRAGKAPQ